MKNLALFKGRVLLSKGNFRLIIHFRFRIASVSNPRFGLENPRDKKCKKALSGDGTSIFVAKTKSPVEYTELCPKETFPLGQFFALKLQARSQQANEDWDTCTDQHKYPERVLRGQIE